MKLLIVRHGDPDYTIDSLTPKGWKEVDYLSEKLAKLDVKAFYVSPLGRARDTASLTLKKMNRTATEEPWLREFDARIHRPDVPEKEMISWDWLPQDWTAEPRFYLPDEWWKVPVMMEGHVKEEYDWVTTNFDALLASHGYVRDGLTYRAEHANNDTIVFFCHFGLECVLLSHLLHISPMVLWHGHLRRSKLRHNPRHRRAPPGDRIFPYEFFRRYFPPVHQRRATGIRSTVL